LSHLVHTHLHSFPTRRSSDLKLTFDIFFPGPDYLSKPQGEPDLEREIVDPATGNTYQIYDSRTLDLVNQLQQSQNEVREISPSGDRKSTRLNSSHQIISYAVF